ncbi:MAG: nucleoside hydrolase [Lentisphaerae bacterium]|nr:nucleoside hydrolase [Lentisphaerota bacterium]
MSNDRIKVLFDTDIGSDIDDAVALAYLLSQPRCELLGITTATGQAQLRAQLASAICRHVGRDDIPIHAGCPQAMYVRIRQAEAQQAAALGAWPRRRDFPPCTAVEFMRQTIRQHPGEITLLAVGPFTNLGVLFALDPEIPSLLKHLVLMSGRFFEQMQGEWNAKNDPHATAIVYGAGCQSRPPRHTSYGLDVTVRCIMPADDVRARFTARVLEPVRDFAEVWFKHAPCLCFHDPLAAAGIFEPELCEYATGLVTVSVTDPTAGWTVLQPGGAESPHTVAKSVRPDAFFDHFFKIVR